FVA
ncbi:hypothetical protein D049_0914B, partial [Vibrio parahaemolyticus VPTS-2010]